MSKVDPNRIMEDRAVNRFAALMQEHAHIVQRIDGRNDFGEDLYVSFVEDMHTTGDTIAVQVKGGVSYRGGNGYLVQIKGHRDSWLNTNVPVVCVVYDPDTSLLYWANASHQLRQAKAESRDLRSIAISAADVLDESSMSSFVRTMREYVAERGQLRQALGNLSGQVFDTTDYLSYSMNEHGEEMVFRQRRGEQVATLLHRDGGWEPIEVTPDALTLGDQFAALGLTTVSQLADHIGNPELKELAVQFEDVDLRSFADTISVVGSRFIVGSNELAWLRACAQASAWWRSAPS